MEIIGRRLTLREFEEYVGTYDFGPLLPNKLVLHHTWRPTVEGWAGERTIAGLKRYYEGKGWPAGPHLFVGPDGLWLFSPMRHDGIHSSSLNPRSVGIEVVGDYDAEVWQEPVKTFALGAVRALQNRLAIGESQIYFHRDVSSKSCPGRAITKEWLFAELQNFRRPADAAFSSAPLPPEAISVTPPILVPEWARESVDFVKTHQLFAVNTQADLRDAVKFHRFYKLIFPNHG